MSSFSKIWVENARPRDIWFSVGVHPSIAETYAEHTLLSLHIARSLIECIDVNFSRVAERLVFSRETEDKAEDVARLAELLADIVVAKEYARLGYDIKGFLREKTLEVLEILEVYGENKKLVKKVDKILKE
ncbi:MAG: hypothetical protein J7J67_01700 [Thermoproteales archaeon]|nr:hypothetical protein [Thermoproteales archaeon]